MRLQNLICYMVLLGAAGWGGTAGADELFSMVIDPFTGAAHLRNDSPSPVNLDGYLLKAPSGPIFDSATWVSLQDSLGSGWRESSPAPNRIADTNLQASTVIPAFGQVDLGKPYKPFVPSAFGQPEPGLGSLNFTYTLANESAPRRGDIEFASRNTLVLVVDPVTGEASLENQSQFNIQLDSYLIRSRASVLATTGWQPLSATDPAWNSSDGRTDRIAEGNLFESRSLTARGGSLSLGRPIDVAKLSDEDDLTLEFTVLAEANVPPITGGVLFRVASPILLGDYDTDRDVDSADLVRFLEAWTGALEQGDPAVAFPNGDLTSDLDVDSEDLVVFLSSWTGTLNAGRQSLAAAQTVPEPGSSLLVLAATAPLIGRLRKCRLRKCRPDRTV